MVLSFVLLCDYRGMRGLLFRTCTKTISILIFKKNNALGFIFCFHWISPVEKNI